MTLEELKQIEDAARIASEESDHERPLLERYLDAKAARESAEEADASGTQIPI